ncbi:MAG: type II toxin-antitoxin system RelE/ParE family toxin [Planctomycetes bacterium]|nr:type II toxin-antitoxin system RelE/ParE family toxin [Planctomycetota bacterium]
MSLPLVFHPDVQGEVDEAYRWYDQQQAGLGDDFLAAIENVFARLRQTPQAHQVIYRGVRRALPRRFPYGVYYRVQADRVEVIAVQHSRRDPRHWQSRV